jgi:hypothetical protein
MTIVHRATPYIADTLAAIAACRRDLMNEALREHVFRKVQRLAKLGTEPPPHRTDVVLSCCAARTGTWDWYVTAMYRGKRESMEVVSYARALSVLERHLRLELIARGVIRLPDNLLKWLQETAPERIEVLLEARTLRDATTMTARWALGSVIPIALKYRRITNADALALVRETFDLVNDEIELADTDRAEIIVELKKRYATLMKHVGWREGSDLARAS